MTSQSGQQTSTIHILPNISRSKKKQTTKLFQLIVYNKKKYVFSNITQKMKQRNQFQTYACFF